MEEIKVNDIMVGNWFIGYDGKPFQWDIEHFAMLETMFVDEIIKAPILLTEDMLLNYGINEQDIYSELKYLHQLQNLFKLLTGNDLNYAGDYI